MEDAEYGPPGALLDAGLAHEHDCVLRGADLDEELPSDLLDSALLDDGHATPWARAGLVLHEDLAPGDAPDSDMHSHGDGPAVAHGAGILDAAAAGAAAQQQPGAAAVAGQPEDLQLQEGHPQAASSDTTEVEGGLSSFPAAGLHAPTTSGAGGTAAGAAAEAMVSTPVTAPTGAEAEVVAEGTSTTGATSAHTAATTHADASDLQPSCSRSPEPCEGAPAVLPVVPGSHVSSSSSSSNNSLDAGSDIPDISDVPPPAAAAPQQPMQLGQAGDSEEQLPPVCADGGAISSSGSAEPPCSDPEAPPSARGAAATTAEAAAAAGNMFASACSSWHTCVSASSSGSAMWRSMGPAASHSSISSSSVAGLKHPTVVLPAGRLSGPASAPAARGAAAASASSPGVTGVEEMAPGSSSVGAAALQCASTAPPGVEAAPGSRLSMVEAPQLAPQQQLMADEEGALCTGAGMVPHPASSVGLADSSKQAAHAGDSPAGSSIGGAHLHHLLPYPQPVCLPATAAPQGTPEVRVAASSGFQLPAGPGGSGPSAAGGAGGYPPGPMPVSMAGYPMASMVMRESQLEDVSLSMSLARDPWAQHPAHSMAPPLPPAAARAVQAAALALTESSYSPAASAQRATPGSGGGGDGSAGGRGGMRAGGGGSMGARGGRPRAAASPAAGSGAQGGWLPRHPLWGVPGALQHLGQQAAAAARGVMSTAASVGRRPSSAAPTTSTSSRPGQGPVGSVAGEEEPVLVSPSGTPRAGGSNSSGGGASGVEFEEERGMVVVQHSPDMPQSLEEMEAEQFRGLLYADGRDSHGRPVLVVDVDRIPAGQQGAPREAALSYLLRQATPLVCQGAYVLVLVASSAGPPFGLLPSWWCLRTYRSLSRPFKKHVRFVVLVQPNMFVRAILTLLTPFLSPKAHTKIKQVDHLLDIDAATRGELQVAHLGESFLSAVQRLPTLAGPR